MNFEIAKFVHANKRNAIIISAFTIGINLRNSIGLKYALER